MGQLTSGTFSQTSIIDMRKRYIAYILKNHRLPTIIYTAVGSRNWVSLHTLDVLAQKYDDYVRANGRPPANVTIESSKPALITKAEQVLGKSINQWGDFYEAVREHGAYSHYDCCRFNDPMVALDHVKSGLNCADYTFLGVAILEALGYMGVKYTWQVEHVYCNNWYRRPDTKAGHFLLIVNGGWCDLAQAADSQSSYGRVMCKYGIGEIIGHTLC